MKVFKFGGASVKDARAVKNLASIVKSEEEGDLLVVVSAMGKTTNKLEALLDSFFYRRGDVLAKWEAIKKFHYNLVDELLEESDSLKEELHNTFVELDWQIEDEPVGSFDFEYDQMVGIGEMLSTKIVNFYLKQIGLKSHWMDVRDCIRTDNVYRNANVDWALSSQQINKKVDNLFVKNKVVVTQGFVGSSSENFTTTLGREGSDFTASIFANSLDAEELVIWKDVEGMYNADPKFFDNVQKLNNISYKEAVELAYYGASVIHPKTIKPLQNKNIPLKVKSFIDPKGRGSLINDNDSIDSLIPSYIHKSNQILISIASKNYDFISEHCLSEIYAVFAELGLSINIMQNSAISFSVCLDLDKEKVDALVKRLNDKYLINYNEQLELYTVRHYNDDIIEELLAKKEILLQQKSRSTARFVVRQNQ